MLQRALTWAKQRLQAWPPAALASELRWSIQACVRNLDRHVAERICVRLKPDIRPRGAVLLSHVIDGFLRPDEERDHHHTNYWESRQIARTFLELGYEVDVISFLNRSFLPQKDYAAVIDSRNNLERLAGVLAPDCLKVFHIDIANVLFHNAAEASRLLHLQQRRGVTLAPRRFEQPNRGIDYADCATLHGNAFTAGTYRYAGKPLHRLPIPAPCTYPWPEHKDWDGCRRHFLFFSSGALVHKGLDLVLEAFARMPDYRLSICAPLPVSPIDAPQARTGATGRGRFDTNRFLAGSAHLEADFCRAYHKELYGLPNVQVVGWTDISSPRFRRIADSCVAVVSPSCSEGASGAVTTCQHAGLIPLVSYQAGIDVYDFGTTLSTCSIDEIRTAIEELATLPPGLVQERARRAWEHARAHHTRDRYAVEYRRLMTKLLRRAPEFPTTPHPGSSHRRKAGRQATRPLLTGARGASSTAIP